MKDFEKMSKFHKALGEPLRLRIVDYLMKKGKCTCICELSKLFGRDQSVIFRHIQILVDAGVLNTCKDGKYLMCCISDKGKLKRLLGD